MKFLNWLFGKKVKKVGLSRAQLAKELEPGLNALFAVSWETVPKWTHAGKKGKTIYCPRCHASTHVYNFAWSALTCSSCKRETDKYLWHISVAKKG